MTALPALASAAPSQAASLFAEAKARETTLRRDLDSHKSETASAALLKRTRTLVHTYQDISRLFPASGYSDDALWHGAMLSADLFWDFGQASDRTMALRLLQALTARFPTSSLVKQVPAYVSRLQSAKASRPAVEPAPATPPAGGAAAQPRGTTRLMSIRRERLPEAERITLELEREAPFHAERIEPSSRLLVDLQQTRAVDALLDSTLNFTDDVVRQVRVGRPQNGRTRIVLDAPEAGRYSVYELYNPYRVVIDFERVATKNTKNGVATKDAKDTKNITEETRPTTRAAARPSLPKPVPPLLTNTPRAWTLALAVPPASVSPVAPASASPVAPTSGSTVASNGASTNGRGGFSLSRQLGLGIGRIVIDAGHGGHDPGAKTKGLTEAELVLDVALRLEKLLQKKAGVDVVMTRRDDTFVPLEERTAIANRAGADLFLSIHANASQNSAARGIETYFLNFAPNPEAEAIAARENSASSRTMRNLPDIVKAIALNNKIDESRDLAANVQTSLYEELRKNNKEARSLGVKQAPFMVLIGATMPSILAEISFITNDAEGSLLKTDKYRQQIAQALFEGILRYQQSLKRTATVAAQSSQ